MSQQLDKLPKVNTGLRHEFLSLAADNPFVANNSSPRAVMHNSHNSSRVSLVTPETKVLLTGIEGELGKYINDVRVDEDVTVKAVIARRRELGDMNPEVVLIVEYEKNNQIWLDLIEVPFYRSNHTYFGYRMHPTPELSDIGYNEPIAAGTVLARTDSLADDGTYAYGVRANAVAMSHPAVAEDGFAVSESFIKKTKFTTMSTKIIHLNRNTIPLNINGTSEVYKFLPSIGERVRPDGLLCATREANKWFSITDLNNDSLAEVDYTFDELIYVPTDSIVVDLKVTRTNYRRPAFTPQMAEQLNYEAECQNNFYREVVSRYESIIRDMSKIYTDLNAVRQTGRLRSYIRDCILKRDIPNDGCHVVRRKVPVEQYCIEVTTMSIASLGIGSKLAGLHGDKGVITAILKDEDMPVDENGVRADIIVDDSAFNSRMIMGAIYELYMGAYARDNTNRIRNNLINKYGKDYKHCLTTEDYKEIYRYLKEVYSYVNTDMVKFIRGLKGEELSQHINEVLDDMIRFFIPPNNEYNIVDMVEAIEKTEYRPHMGKVSYLDELGNYVTTKNDVRIGNKYILVLDKTADNHSAVSSAKVNSFNLPIKGGRADKHKYPHSLTPTTTISETEGRILASYANPELLAELMDSALNPITHKFVIKSILENDKAFSNKFEVDRKVNPYGKTKPLMLLEHVFGAYGFRYKYVPPSK